MLFKHSAKSFAVLLVVLCLIAGASAYVRLEKSSKLTEYSDTEMIYTAQLISYPRKYENKYTGWFRILECPFEGEGEKLLLSIKINEGEDFELICGGVYHIQGAFYAPQSSSNPGGFDYALYLKEKGIYICCTCEPSDISLKSRGTLPFGLEKLYALREISASFFARYLDEESAYLAESLIFGENGLSEETLISYRASGVAHILSVSGIHTLIIYRIIKSLLRALRASPKAAYWLTLGALFFYSAITGFSSPVIRASVMLCFSNTGEIMKRQTDMLNNMCLCAVVMLLLNPLLLVSSSFVMSFACTAAMAVFAPALVNKAKHCFPFLARGKVLPNLTDSFCVTFCVNLVMLPISALYFNTFSYVAIFSNLLMGFLVDGAMRLLLIGLTLSFLPILCGVLFTVIQLIFNLMASLSFFFASLPFAFGTIPTPGIHTFIVYYALIFLLFGYIKLNNSKGRRLAVVILAVALTIAGVSQINYRRNWVSFLDVGQADCSVIHTRSGKTVLIDCGRDNKSAETILRFLWKKGVNHIDCVVVSHSDADHAGGLMELIGSIPISSIVMNGDESSLYAGISERAEKSGIRLLEAYKSDIISLGEFSMVVLSPGVESYPFLSDNDRSLVLSTELDGVKLLYLGDAGVDIHKEILLAGSVGEAQIVKASHHGSYTSVTGELYSHCNVQLAVISVGRNNYSLPDFDFLLYLRENEITFFRTDESGCISIDINKGKYKVTEYGN